MVCVIIEHKERPGSQLRRRARAFSSSLLSRCLKRRTHGEQFLVDGVPGLLWDQHDDKICVFRGCGKGAGKRERTGGVLVVRRADGRVCQP